MGGIGAAVWTFALSFDFVVAVLVFFLVLWVSNGVWKMKMGANIGRRATRGYKQERLLEEPFFPYFSSSSSVSH